MEGLTTAAMNYVCKISKQKFTVDSISTFFNNEGINNFDIDSISETLKEMPHKDLSTNSAVLLISLQHRKLRNLPLHKSKHLLFLEIMLMI